MDGDTFDPLDAWAVTRGLGEEGDNLAMIGDHVARAGPPVDLLGGFSACH
jgi:hypothetical protein